MNNKEQKPMTAEARELNDDELNAVNGGLYFFSQELKEVE